MTWMESGEEQWEFEVDCDVPRYESDAWLQLPSSRPLDAPNSVRCIRLYDKVYISGDSCGSEVRDLLTSDFIHGL